MQHVTVYCLHYAETVQVQLVRSFCLLLVLYCIGPLEINAIPLYVSLYLLEILEDIVYIDKNLLRNFCISVTFWTYFMIYNNGVFSEHCSYRVPVAYPRVHDSCLIQSRRKPP